MELREIDENEAAEPVEASTTEPEQVDTPEVKKPEIAEEPAQEPVETEQPKTVEEQPAEVEPKKPNRAEQRIKEVVAENKRLREQQAYYENLQPQTLDGSEITQEDLQKIIDQRAYQAAQLMMSSMQNQNEYGNNVKEWSEDFDKVKAENPELDPKSPDYDAELDKTLARIMDDGTGKPRLDVKVSEIISQFKKRQTSATQSAEEKGKSQATATLAKQMQEGAVTPTAQKIEVHEGYSDEELADMRVNNPQKYLDIIDKI